MNEKKTQEKIGLICPYCKRKKTSVTDSRGDKNKTKIRRRRECLYCKERFTTYEFREVDIKLLLSKKFKLLESFMKSLPDISSMLEMTISLFKSFPIEDPKKDRLLREKKYQRNYYKTSTVKKRLKERIERLEKRISGAK